MVRFDLTPAQKALYQRIAGFVKQAVTHDIGAFDEKNIFPRAAWEKCGEEKLQGLCISGEYGGAGLDAISAAAALEALGYASNDNGLNFSIAAHLLACTKPIELHGTTGQKEKLLPLLCNGKLIAANAMTEPASGSDAFAMKTIANRRGDEFVLTGSKNFVTNGTEADLLLVYAITDPAKGFHGGVSAFLVDSATEGITRSAPIKKMGLRTSPMCQIHFENVIVPASRLLGQEGAGGPIFSESMNWERTLLSALHLGTMTKIIEKCVAEVKTNDLSSQQGIAFLIADMCVKSEASRLLVYRGAQHLESDSRKVAPLASMAKAFCSDSLETVCQAALQVFGTKGYTTQDDLGRFVRDSVAARLYSGTTEIQKNIIAAWL